MFSVCSADSASVTAIRISGSNNIKESLEQRLKLSKQQTLILHRMLFLS